MFYNQLSLPVGCNFTKVKGIKLLCRNRYFGLILFCGSLLFLQISCVKTNDFSPGKKLVCNAEQTNQKGDKFVAVDDSTALFNDASRRTNLQSRSGSFSVLTIPKKKAFAFGYQIKHTGPDWYFKVSVWRKSKDGKGALVAAAKNTDLLYLAVTTPVERTADGWERLEMDVFTPPSFVNERLSFYVWNNDTDTVYYDDFTIERFHKPPYPDYKDYPLSLMLDTSAYMKIQEKRKEAFLNGILQTTDDDWVKGIVFGDKKMMKAKLRLKGDWLDHLSGNKWSFRVKMRKDYTWNRLKIFSLQTPATRAYLMEWMAHKLFQSKDVLTTRYGYLPLLLNNEPRGLYAWEEHFTKQLLESHERREGPIVKFTEDAFWEVQKMFIHNKKWCVFPYYEAAVIKPFGENKTINNPVLFQQFQQAQKLMHQYKLCLKPPKSIFDLEKLAGYFAMFDLASARHGLAWHNQRLYYNPILCKLEPIAFDCYSDHYNNDMSIDNNMAYYVCSSDELSNDWKAFSYLFTDSLFLSLYVDKLIEVSDSSYIEKILSDIQPQQHYYDSLLKMEFPYVYFDDQLIRNSAKGIRNYLPELKTFLKPWLTSTPPEIKITETVYTDTTVFEKSPEFFINSYIESVTGDSMIVSIHNFLPRELILLGTSKGNKHITHYFPVEPSVNAYDKGMEGVRLDMKVDSSANFLYFMLKGRFDTYKVPINQWPYPSGITPQQELYAHINLTNNSFIDKIEDNLIFIKRDSLVVDQPLIIPEGYQVYFQPGTIINLVNNAMFISYSPVFMNGVQDNPVTITSSDFSANGFTVLQASGRSKLKHVVFENLNTLDYKGWTLTGAVTFYESDVDISNTHFYRNQCEDALNTIRSDFKLEKSTFDHIYSDAFDSDFCTGLVTNCRFNNIGNDAIDFSGSQIQIIDTEIIEAKDKGISGGEDSYLTVENTTILRSNIGLASKDLSTVDVTNSSVIDCNYGIVLLQKKPEYGPAKMTLINTSINNAKTIHLIEIGSEAVIDGKKIKGNRKDLADIFY